MVDGVCFLVCFAKYSIWPQKGNIYVGVWGCASVCVCENKPALTVLRNPSLVKQTCHSKYTLMVIRGCKCFQALSCARIIRRLTDEHSAARRLLNKQAVISPKPAGHQCCTENPRDFWSFLGSKVFTSVQGSSRVVSWYKTQRDFLEGSLIRYLHKWEGVDTANTVNKLKSLSSDPNLFLFVLC